MSDEPNDHTKGGLMDVDPKLADSIGKWGVGTIAMVGVMILAYLLGVRFLDEVSDKVGAMLVLQTKHGEHTSEYLQSEKVEESHVLRIARALEALAVTHEKWREADKGAMADLTEANKGTKDAD